MFDPAVIHHDFKADNIVISGDSEAPESDHGVKVIDFGCYVMADVYTKHSQSIGDPTYMPPEHSLSNAFDNPPSSFDMYGAGLIHMELLCPALQQDDWDPP